MALRCHYGGYLDLPLKISLAVLDNKSLLNNDLSKLMLEYSASFFSHHAQYQRSSHFAGEGRHLVEAAGCGWGSVVVCVTLPMTVGTWWGMEGGLRCCSLFREVRVL